MYKALLPVLVCCCALASAKDELKFEHTALKAKVKPEQDAFTVAFPFKNTSGKTVKLGKITTNCDCTTAVYRDGKTSLNPGESSAVLATMTTGTFSGEVSKELTVRALDSQYKLTLNAVVPEVVKIAPRKLEWKTGEAPTPKTITITVDHKQLDLKLTDVSLEGDGFDYEPVTVRAGKEYKVIITPKSTAKRNINTIWLLTDSPIPRYSRFFGVLAITPNK